MLESPIFLLFTISALGMLVGHLKVCGLSLGAACACMTNPPALAAANALTDSPASAVAFASVYPIALISKILLAQMVFLLLRL
jgi:putative transport protein